MSQRGAPLVKPKCDDEDIVVKIHGERIVGQE